MMKWQRRTAIVLVLAFVLTAPWQLAAKLHAADPVPSWQVGVAHCQITPTHSMPMAGYAARTQWPDRKLHDLWAKAMVLQDAQGNQAVLITLDVLGVARDVSLPICQEIEKRHGIPRAAIAICSSHTHTGPVVGANLPAAITQELSAEAAKLIEGYAQSIIEQVSQLVGQALAERRPAKLSYGAGTATFAVNRRNNPEAEVPTRRTAGTLAGPVDHDVPLLVVRDEEDTIRAIVCGYACHATVLGDVVWSGDWPGFAQIEIERRHPQATAFFWAGCGADQNPLPRRTVPLAEGYGKQLADAVDVALAKPLTPLAPTLRICYEEIELPFGKVPTREQFVQEAAGSGYAATRAKLVLKRAGETGPIETAYPHYPVQCWQLGNAVDWVFLGGEVVVDYAIRIKSPADRTTWVAGYSNDVMAYIPSRRVLLEGGYEGRDSMVYYGLPGPWHESVEEKIIAEVDKQRSTVAAGEHQTLNTFRNSAGQQEPIKSPSDWQKRREQILLGMRAVMGELPDRSQLAPPTVEVLEETVEPPFVRQSIMIAVDEHDRVPAYFYLPTHRPAGKKLPAILALHQTVPLGKKEVDGQGTADQRYARELAERGFVVLAPDYPSFGDYPCDFSDNRFVSGTIKGVYNHMRCVDWLTGRDDVDAKRIGVIGHSLGGHNSLFLAAFDPRIQAVVSSCGWTPFHDYYGGKLAGWTSPRYMPRIRDVYQLDPDRVPFDFYEVVAALAPRAFLSISPLHDGNFDVAGVRKGMDRVGEIYRLLDAEENLQARYPECEHSFPESERAAAYEFLSRYLKLDPSAAQ